MGDVEPHIYAGGIIGDEAFRENVLAFAERHGCSMAGLGSGERAREAFAECADRGIDVMINPGAGKVHDYSGRELATEEAAMADHLDGLRAAVEVYADYFPEGRIFLWHEAPLGGDWEGETLDEQAENMLEYGPDIFAAQKEAVREVAPDMQVGIFIHHPFMPSAEHTKKPYFQEIMDELREKPGDALPDFTYCDFYRGYDEWEAGYEATNEYLADVIANAREATGGRPIHYLGEAHAINNNYCPSKQAIVGNLRAAVEAGADGYGWYNRGSLRVPHDRTYNPFLPNTGSVEGDFDSVRGSRDRWRWAFLLLDDHLEGTREDDRFDLWLYGHDLDYYEHRVSVRDAEGEWEYLGDVSGYWDGDNPYSGGDRDRVHAFHGLDRSYLEGGLEVRVETAADADGTTLEGVYAVPYATPGNYWTEPEATALVESGAAAEAALGFEDGEATLSAGGTYTNTVAVDSEHTVGGTALARDVDVDRLADIEADDGFRPDDYFDLWVYGDGVADATVEIDGEDVTDYGDGGGDGREALVLRGLSREEHWRFHLAGDFVDLEIEPGNGTVRGVWVMPYHGTVNPKTPSDVVEIVEREEREGHDQLATFCLGTATGKTGAGGTFTRWLDINERRLCECDPYCDFHAGAPWPPWHELDT